ncbi:MAG: hypothetical protein AB3N23_17455 [Paracoccaceae bacterium]
MPWPAIFVLVAVGVVVLTPSFAYFTGRAPAAIPGLAAGMFGALLSPRHRIPWPLIAGAVGVVILAGDPSKPMLYAVALALSAIAGAEAVRTGGRSGVLAIFMCTGLHLIPAMPNANDALLPALLALAAGWGLIQLTPLAGQAVQPPAPRAFGVGLAAFLIVGLAIAVFAVHHVHDGMAHLLALLFITRGLAPPGQVVRGALRFGVGAVGGSLGALMAIHLGLPVWVLLALSAVVLVLGLRMLPHPGPYAPAAFSAAILLATAPSVHAALFRVEAAVFAVLLSVALATLFSVIWSAAERAYASRATSSGS